MRKLELILSYVSHIDIFVIGSIPTSDKYDNYVNITITLDELGVHRSMLSNQGVCFVIVKLRNDLISFPVINTKL